MYKEIYALFIEYYGIPYEEFIGIFDNKEDLMKEISSYNDKDDVNNYTVYACELNNPASTKRFPAILIGENP
jgi:hypothetical protein